MFVLLTFTLKLEEYLNHFPEFHPDIQEYLYNSANIIIVISMN